jgi:hypothetical protein
VPPHEVFRLLIFDCNEHAAEEVKLIKLNTVVCSGTLHNDIK